MAEVVLFDLRSGDRLVRVPTVSHSWDRPRNAVGQVRCAVPLYDPQVRRLDLRNVALRGKTLMAVIEDDGWVAQAAIVGKPTYDQDAQTLVMAGAAFRAHLNRRLVRAVAAYTAPPATFLVADPADASKTIPNPVLRTNVSGLDLGSIGFSLVRQALAVSGGELPIVVPADRPGTHERTWEVTDEKPLGDALFDLSGVEGGPDIAFDPRIRADGLGLEFVMRAGTEEEPLLRGSQVHRFDTTVRDPSTRRLELELDIDRMASVGWATGGRVADRALFARHYDATLVVAGHPLRERVVSHGTVTVQSTLDRHARTITTGGRTPDEFWSFEIRKARALQLGVREGDLCDVVVKNDPIIPDGEHRRDIAGISSDGSDWLKITTSEV